MQLLQELAALTRRWIVLRWIEPLRKLFQGLYNRMEVLIHGCGRVTVHQFDEYCEGDLQDLDSVFRVV